jgi:hypothetical protein
VVDVTLITTSDEQIGFLVQAQTRPTRACSWRPTSSRRLLALADLSIEPGDDSGGELAVSAASMNNGATWRLLPRGLPKWAGHVAVETPDRRASGGAARQVQ